MNGFRLIQVFLSGKAGMSGPGIFEVSGDENQSFICTCPGYAVKRNCRHVRFVKERIKVNGGVYPLQVNPDVPESAIKEALKSSEEFREFLLKHGKIEVY